MPTFTTGDDLWSAIVTQFNTIYGTVLDTTPSTVNINAYLYAQAAKYDLSAKNNLRDALNATMGTSFTTMANAITGFVSFMATNTEADVIDSINTLYSGAATTIAQAVALIAGHGESAALDIVRVDLNNINSVHEDTLLLALNRLKTDIVTGEATLPSQERDTVLFNAFKTNLRASADSLIGKTGITRTMESGHTGTMRFNPNVSIDNTIDLTDATLATDWATGGDHVKLASMGTFINNVGLYLDTVTPDNLIHVYQTL